MPQERLRHFVCTAEELVIVLGVFQFLVKIPAGAVRKGLREFFSMHGRCRLSSYKFTDFPLRFSFSSISILRAPGCPASEFFGFVKVMMLSIQAEALPISSCTVTTHASRTYVGGEWRRFASFTRALMTPIFEL